MSSIHVTPLEFFLDIDATTSHVPVNHSLYGGGYFGSIMCGPMVDGDVSILNGIFLRESFRETC